MCINPVSVSVLGHPGAHSFGHEQGEGERNDENRLDSTVISPSFISLSKTLVYQTKADVMFSDIQTV